jgi:hypothetical protein
MPAGSPAIPWWSTVDRCSMAEDLDRSSMT